MRDLLKQVYSSDDRTIRILKNPIQTKMISHKAVEVNNK